MTGKDEAIQIEAVASIRRSLAQAYKGAGRAADELFDSWNGKAPSAAKGGHSNHLNRSAGSAAPPKSSQTLSGHKRGASLRGQPGGGYRHVGLAAHPIGVYSHAFSADSCRAWFPAFPVPGSASCAYRGAG